MGTKELAKTIADGRKDTDDLKPQFGAAGDVTSFFNLYQQTIQPVELYTVQNTRTLGSSFILGHSQLGVLGTTSPQPYLGDSRGTWTLAGITSPNKIFTEYFAGSRFKDASTTGEWTNVGSVVLGSGENIVSTTVAMGNELINYSTVSAVGTMVGIVPYYVDANTVGLYHCNTGTGTTLTDETGDNNGTFASAPNNPSWTTTYKEGTYALSCGVGDYVDMPSTLSMSGWTQGTVEMWIYLNEIPTGTASCYSDVRTTDTYRVLFAFYTSAVPNFQVITNTDTITLTSPDAIPTGQWVHIAGRFDAARSLIELLVNGVVKASSSTAFSNIITTANDYIRIGNRKSTYKFNGLIDEVRISNIYRESFNLTTSTLSDGVQFQATANGSNWENTVLGVQHTFTNTGSDLRIKATENIGNTATINSFEVKY